jgi:hypothetical protein
MLEARCNVDIQYSGVCHVRIKGDWALNIDDDVAQDCSSISASNLSILDQISGLQYFVLTNILHDGSEIPSPVPAKLTTYKATSLG